MSHSTITWNDYFAEWWTCSCEVYENKLRTICDLQQKITWTFVNLPRDMSAIWSNFGSRESVQPNKVEVSI